jgi:cytosine/adenosine deaminase-related metal-dependent hydrolase
VRAAGELARELGSFVHVHVAEDGADVADAHARGYAGPLERLHALGALPPGSILAHGVFLDAAQVRMAAAWGCWLVQNPRSNRGNRVGYPAHLAASGRVALGTDGYPADLAAELAALFEVGSAQGEPLAALEARLYGSQELARSLFPDAGDDEAAAAPPPSGHAAGFVRATQAARALRLEVEGRLVVENGELKTADIETLRAHAREEAPRLWRRMSEVPA